MAKDQPAKTPAAPQHWKSLHLWQIQPVRDVLVFAALFGLLYLGYILRVVTVPILVALMLAYMTEPLIRWLARPKVMSRSTAALLFIFGAGAVILVPTVLGTVFAAAQGIRVVNRVADNSQLLIRSIDDPKDESLQQSLPPSWRKVREYILQQTHKPTPAVLPAPGEAGAHPAIDPDPSLPEQVKAETGETLRSILNWVRENSKAIGQQAIVTTAGVIQSVARFFGSLSVFIFGAALTAFFYYFFSTGWGKVLEFWESLIPERRKGRVIELVGQMDRVIAGFIRGRLIIAAIQSLLFVVGFFLVGTPASLIVGVAAGILAIVPYVSIVIVPIAALLMWLEPGSGYQATWWWIIFAPLGVFMIGQAIGDYVLTPIIQGKSTEMDTATIVFVSLACGILAVVYGLLLAIPFAACVNILLREVFWPRFREWGRGRVSDPLPISQT